MLCFPRIASCKGKGLIVMLGADLWLTGLSGAQNVRHSTNRRCPCPCWLLGQTDWIYSLMSWPTDVGVVEVWQKEYIFIFWVEPCVLCTRLFRKKPRVETFVWSLSVDLTLYNSSHSLCVPLCESMISRDCSLFLGRQLWNEPYLQNVILCVAVQLL